MKSVRIERINSEIQKTVSEIIDTKLRDPQIDAIISVNQVDTTPDLAYSKVYISSIGNTPKEEVIARLKGAGGFIRGQLSKNINLRKTPRLEFILDTSEEYASKIENILKTIKYSTSPDDTENEND